MCVCVGQYVIVCLCVFVCVCGGGGGGGEVGESVCMGGVCDGVFVWVVT